MNDCCEKCIHFISDGFTVAEIDKSYEQTRYADIVVGRCALPEHEFDPNNSLSGVEHLRWGSHTPCMDYQE
ncbi:MAG: hypothetical protein J1D89_09370 [Agathobacter sp.]|nr:hypothetical protein [Agathobacter sp.]